MVQLTKDEIINITMRLQSVRQGLVQKAPFYALLLYGLRFSLDDMVERVYTDGERIAFNPDFLKKVSDRELEFIMIHEVSHVALGHPFRCLNDYDIEIFDEACDIVVNSNIYHHMNDDESFITITDLGVMPHRTYNGEEGYKFTVEQVYDHLYKIKGKKKKDEYGTTPDFDDIFDEEELDEENIEDEDCEDVEGMEDEEDTSEENSKSGKDRKHKKSKQKKGALDKDDNGGEDCEEDEDADEGTEDFDDDIDDEEVEVDEGDSGATVKKREKRKAKNGEGVEDSECLEDCEEDEEDEESGDSEVGEGDEKVEDGGAQKTTKGKCSKKGKTKPAPIQKAGKIQADNKIIRETKQIILKSNVKVTCFDDHSFWRGDDEKHIKEQTWNQRVVDAYHTSNIIMQDKVFSKLHATKTFGGAPMFAQRLLKSLTEGRLDWKTLLNDFVQEEICDYSFSPPDRRFGDSDFFLPDFNEKSDSIKNIWFVVDTSGSISDGMIMDAYNEIASAIEIFGGSIESFLSFTESFITKPVPFSSVDDLLSIIPKGGGGNNFKLIFKYLETGEGLELKDKKGQVISVDEIIEPSCIVIITDGYDEFPKESMAKGIPVLWLINNNDATPPWGMIARIPQKNNENDAY